jgi:hypothetical protein
MFGRQVTVKKRQESCRGKYELTICPTQQFETRDWLWKINRFQVNATVPKNLQGDIILSSYVWGSRLTYADYLAGKSFVSDIAAWNDHRSRQKLSIVSKCYSSIQFPNKKCGLSIGDIPR